MDFSVVHMSINTMTLMITTVIQCKQHLCSSAVSSFLDSGNAQALNGKSGLLEDFKKTHENKTKSDNSAREDVCHVSDI